MLPEAVLRIADKLHEGVEKTPRMWSLGNAPFEDNPVSYRVNNY